VRFTKLTLLAYCRASSVRKRRTQLATLSTVTMRVKIMKTLNVHFFSFLHRLR